MFPITLLQLNCIAEVAPWLTCVLKSAIFAVIPALAMNAATPAIHTVHISPTHSNVSASTRVRLIVKVAVGRLAAHSFSIQHVARAVCQKGIRKPLGQRKSLEVNLFLILLLMVV